MGNRGHWIAGLMALCGVLALPASAVASTDYTWTGATAPPQTPTGPPTFMDWSTSSNWQGGTAPSGSVDGVLHFPALTSSACTTQSSSATCYHATDDVSGLSATGLTIDDGVGYFIDGTNTLTLNASGLTAAPSASDSGFGFPNLSLPIALGADQTWSITGGSHGQHLMLSGGLTGSYSLGVSFNPSSTTAPTTGLYLTGTNEVGAVSVSGNGNLLLGNPGATGDLNGTNGHAVSFTGGAGLVATQSPSNTQSPSKIGALTMTGGNAQIGAVEYPTQLSVKGGVTLNSNPTMSFDVQGTTTAGTDYSQVSATGDVSLGSSADLSVSGSTSNSGSTCPTLTQGQTIDLITTTGSLTGTFANAPAGSTVTVSCSSGPTSYLQIGYTNNAVTATVVSAPVQTQTTTTLVPSPTTAITNQRVALTATVGPNAASPSGYVKFSDNGVPIIGCDPSGTGQGEPVGFNTSTNSYTATCYAMFAATTSPESLTAIFTSSSSDVAGSQTTSPVSLTVGKTRSRTTVSVSPTLKPALRQVETYKATVWVALPGSTRPTGKVEFLDNGVAAKCQGTTGAVQPISSTGIGICKVSYTAKGSHKIQAKYLGDSNFFGSALSAVTASQTVAVQ